MHKKKRCPVEGCREKLTTISSYTCKDCGATVCLRHRLGSDHACAGARPVAGAAASAGRWRQQLGSLKKLFGGSGSGGGEGPGGGAAAAGPVAPAARVAALQQPQHAARRQQPPPPAKPQRAAAAQEQQEQLKAYREAQRQRAGGGAPVGLAPAAAAAAAAASSGVGAVGLTGPPAAPAAASTPAAEVCPQCGAGFASVQQLIAHAESAHAEGWASGQLAPQQQQRQHQPRQPQVGPSGLERCPHCGQTFGDAVELVAHVERQHAAQMAGKETCVLC